MFFLSVSESIIFVLVLHDYMPECLLERKDGHYGPRNELRASVKYMSGNLSLGTLIA